MLDTRNLFWSECDILFSGKFGRWYKYLCLVEIIKITPFISGGAFFSCNSTGF